ncbi:MAG: hypothetical protein J7642_21400 [Cyanobacteria bacterium SBC]|nr:hypothetical protein [Cyanobacteria bacterium SBC]
MVLEGFSERPADLPLPTLTHGILVSHRRIQTLQGVINFRGLYDFGVSVEWTPDEVACEVCDRVARILQKLTHEHRSFLLHEIDPELASQIWQAIVEVAFTQVERKVLRLNDFEDL